MPRSEAKARADKKYKATLKRFVVEVHPDEMEEINNAKKKYGLSGKQLIRCALEQLHLERETIAYAKKLYDKCATFKEVRALSGLTQMKFSEIFHIPRRTIQDWEAGTNKIAPYQLELIKYFLIHEGIINTKKTEE